MPPSFVTDFDIGQYREMSNQSGAVRCVPLAREPLSDERADGLSRMFKALGDPVRLRLLSLVASHAGGEACNRPDRSCVAISSSAMAARSDVVISRTAPAAMG